MPKASELAAADRAADSEAVAAAGVARRAAAEVHRPRVLVGTQVMPLPQVLDVTL